MQACSHNFQVRRALQIVLMEACHSISLTMGLRPGGVAQDLPLGLCEDIYLAGYELQYQAYLDVIVLQGQLQLQLS